jgi:hypothetical protein
MRERKREREKLSGDVSGPSQGDYSFTDWDNPEDDVDADEVEEAPEGYYEDEEGEDEPYELTPDDPDYDLSEAAGYSGWEAPRRRTPIPEWAIVALSLLLVASLLLPVLLRID